MKELKSCPFCGCKAKVCSAGFDHKFVRCSNIEECGCKIEWFENEEEAIDAWNRRIENNIQKENPHGYWITDYPADPQGIEQGYRCSVCNTFFFMNKNFVKRASYCCNCGAKMDEVRE